MTAAERQSAREANRRAMGISGLLDALGDADKRIKELEAEIAMLNGNPEAVHLGAMAAVSAIKQMNGMSQKIEDMSALLAEAYCWIPDGTRNTPEQRGAIMATAYGVLRAIESMKAAA